MSVNKIYSLALALLFCSVASLAFGEKVIPVVQLQNLRCEILVNPLGIDVVNPRLSWEIIADERNVQQTSYHILVASSAEKLNNDLGDLWDSGAIKSDQSVHLKYAGKPLASRMDCFWKVKVITNKGETKWSATSKWSMGLLKPLDWKAKWIGWEAGFPWDSVSKFSRLSARYFRKEFTPASDVKKAMVSISGLGHYELYLNGKAVSDEVLTQMPTDYNKTIQYSTYDVTSAIRQGKNAVATILGNGRYFTMRPRYKPKKIKEFGFPKMLLQLDITYQNGTHQSICSDQTWRMTADGPIRSNNEYDGEEYDATKELANWNNIGFNDAKWLQPQLVTAPAGQLVAQMSEPIKVMRTVKPISITEYKPGAYILDMGQNFSGWLQMKVQGKRGEQVTMRFSETLQKTGDLYVANLRDAKVTDIYTLKGGGLETWHPVFVFHGFRYVEVTGYPGKPTLNDFEGQVVYDALENSGSFETSNPVINQIYKNTVWGVLSNYKGMPVDCPQRNERMPWLGDRAVGSLGESFIFDNETLYAKWLDDIEQSQTAEGSIPDVAPAYWNYYSDNMTWPGTYILIADMLHTQFGDKAPIEKHYPSMKKWLAYMQAKYAKNNIMTKDKYADWCVPPESLELIHAKDTSRTTNGQLIATAYWYHLLGLMNNFARLLNKPQDVAVYTVLSAKVKDAFNQKYFDTKTNQYDNGTVTANMLPLYFGMVPAESYNAVFANVAQRIVTVDKGHIGTGVIGTQWLMRGLSDNGRPDLAYQLASNTDYPSWGYMVKQGATTIWELWNGNTANPQMNSGNHIMLLGDLIAWYYQNLAGIKSDPSKPGFKELVMKPEPVDGLDFVNASYHSINGLIKSNWSKDNKVFNWNISIPANTSAVVYVPAKTFADVQELGMNPESANEVRFLRMENGRAVFRIGAGNYSFKSNR